MTETVDGDGGDDDGTRDALLHPVVEADFRAAVVDDGHQERAEEGPEDRALSAGEGGAADDNGGDDLELGALGGRRVADGEVGELEDGSDAGAADAEDVDEELRPLDVDAAEARGLGVGADGEVYFRRAAKASATPRRIQTPAERTPPAGSMRSASQPVDFG